MTSQLVMRQTSCELEIQVPRLNLCLNSTRNLQGFIEPSNFTQIRRKSLKDSIELDSVGSGGLLLTEK